MSTLSFTVPDDILHHLLDPVSIPGFALVRQRLNTPDPMADITEAVVSEIRRSGGLDRVRPGMTVAIGVGSRGIDRLSEVVTVVVDEVRARGAHPVIIPTMGSHGGATSDGQREVLARLGITPDLVGAPIHSSMDTVVVGTTVSGMPVHLDAFAASADGIVVVARIKPHTAFRGMYESGVAKMLAIGLGKQAGAAATHAYGFGRMAEMVPAMASVVLDRMPILFGLGLLENAHDRIFKVVALPPDRIMVDEPVLLQEARAAMPRLPFETFDVLIIDRIGKDISGDGADPNITGRYPTPDASGPPDVVRQVVLDLTDASDGNANGVGTADFTTVRLAAKIDLGHTYPNSLTSTVPGPVKIPMVLPNDRLAVAAAILTCNAVGRSPRVVRVCNTLQLERFWVSESLMADVNSLDHVDVLEPVKPLTFDEVGNLADLALLAHSATVSTG